MKKFMIFAFCLILCIGSIFAYAANHEYTVDEIGISIKLPDSFYVFTRDTLPDDEKFASLGISHEGMMSLFENESIYLEAMNAQDFSELVIICEETDKANYFDMGIDALYNAIVAEEAEIEKSGRTIVDADLFEANGVDFVKIYSDADDRRIQYSTVYNGKRYEIRYTYFDKNISNAEDESIDALAEALVFLQKPAKAQELKKSHALDETPKSEPASAEPEKTRPETENKTQSSASDKLIDILIFLVIGITVCIASMLILKFAFVRMRLGKAVSLCITLICSLAMSAVFCSVVFRNNTYMVQSCLCLIFVVWGIIIYKIVKYR